MTHQTFAELGVPAALVSVVAADGKAEPFPIQADTLPDTLAGRDVLGRGKTGSGKTIAFSLPLAARLGADREGGASRKRRPRGLVLAPTRELATQIDATLAPLAAALGLRTTTIFGGVSQSRQVTALQAGIDIVVACPGRLDDLMKQGILSLDAIEITVLDEADHMADLGFLPTVTRILDKTPAGGQRLLFSATLDNGVDKLVKRFLRDEVLHSVDDATSHVEAMTHHVFEVAGPEAKKELVHALASGRGRRILFTRTKHQAKRLAKQLTSAGVPAVDLHGNLSQAARDRNLAAFGSGAVRVLVATDVAARGVHVDDVELVVHVDPPAEHKAYLHRSGRTARAGSAGDVVTVMLPEQAGDMRSLLRAAAISATPQKVTSQSEPVRALVGEPAERVAPAAPAQSSGRGQGAGRSAGTGRGQDTGRGRSGRDQRPRAQTGGNAPARSRTQTGHAAPPANGRAGARRASSDGRSGEVRVVHSAGTRDPHSERSATAERQSARRAGGAGDDSPPSGRRRGANSAAPTAG
ncbi:ATP-dependent RNA helicase [Leifsonia xyli subsp. cynodontis DSM 46306]|uniref:DEAD/DEAH box helicase n=1 Tax=Leifsonia xyli subsp. cynodontis DSM 46306 TaxID=1389489 RepID=U3PAS4_LEIXC|nr:DEAD/DEAH box helicase [Leifsonia xyli]AGW40598.1 ATP-dependent RNA helicase [Leifsonia xyli subsp. cynodontis DSM 46306]